MSTKSDNPSPGVEYSLLPVDDEGNTGVHSPPVATHQAQGVSACPAHQHCHGHNPSRRLLFCVLLLAPYVIGSVTLSIYMIVRLFKHSSETQMRASGVIAHLIPCIVTFAVIFALLRRRNSPSLPEYLRKHFDIILTVMVYWALMGLLSWLESILVPILQGQRSSCWWTYNGGSNVRTCHSWVKHSAFYGAKLVVALVSQLVLLAILVFRRRSRIHLRGPDDKLAGHE